MILAIQHYIIRKTMARVKRSVVIRVLGWVAVVERVTRQRIKDLYSRKYCVTP